MIGIRTAIAGSMGGGQSWASTLYNQTDLNFWYKSDRSGLTLPDTINPGAGDAKILLPSYMAVDRASGESFQFAADKNIGTVYSIYFRGRLDNSAFNTVMQSSTSWGVWLHNTSRYWYHKAGTVAVQSANNAVTASFFTDNAFHDFLITRNGTAVNFYIDGVAQGAELTLASNPDWVGKLMNGSTNYGIKYLTEIKIHSTVKSAADAKADTPDVHWLIFTGYNCVDVITGERLTKGAAVNFDNTYLSQVEGSSYALNSGYSLYTVKAGFSNTANIYLPYKAGVANTLTVPATGYVKDSDHPGSTTNHNLADTFIEFSQTGWDRSDVTLWNDSARVVRSAGGYYDSANPKVWHISELNQRVLILYGVTLKKSLNFAKIRETVDWRTDCWNGDGVNLKEIFSYATNKTGADLEKVLLYTKESGVHAIDYYFSNTHYCATYLDKILAFDGTDTMSLSTDGGATFPTTKQIVGMSDQVQFAYIFENGNILFCTPTKAYYSTDSLATYGESSMQDADGSPATLGTYSNFRPLTVNQRIKIGAQEIVVWGRYIASPTEYEGEGYKTTNAVWYSLDGTVVKKACQIAVTEPVLNFNHVHAISYDAVNNYFYMQTGDGVGNEHLLKGVYNVDTDAWTWTLVASSTTETRYQSTGIVFDSSYAYLGEEQYHKFIKTTRANIVNKAAFIDLYTEANNVNGFFALTGTFIDEMIHVEAGIADAVSISIDKKNFILWRLYGGSVTNALDSFFAIKPKNSDGYYLVETVLSAETTVTWNKGQVLMLRIIKPED